MRGIMVQNRGTGDWEHVPAPCTTQVAIRGISSQSSLAADMDSSWRLPAFHVFLHSSFSLASSLCSLDSISGVMLAD